MMKLTTPMKSLITFTQHLIVPIVVFSMRHTKRNGLLSVQMSKRGRIQELVTAALTPINTLLTNAGNEAAVPDRGKR
jgi:UDP-N-acetylmuramyl pentapeptide synthase